MSGFLSLGAWRARSAGRAAEAARVKALLAPLLALGPEDALSVSEIACAEPGCPDVETVVLVMRLHEPTRAIRVRHPLGAIGPEECRAVAAEEALQRAPLP
ncbi:hypothetical protein [Methylobacterium organophilum]|uniref:Nitrate reductase n=1 Tax=Methylobacterium organophilum TaxID=410 RepID=A0ABQ4T5U8_METOR|nr:hypothetical protein [Methylobacterium organophilum]UMY17281.1 hypothetical protein MMB17_22025 [Methylobacterium organophilum]GJE26683.1 hypothetical protein LKMONMHP_1534 [Methylobacterium organophilum]